MDVVEIVDRPSTASSSVTNAIGPVTSEASTSSKISFGVKKKKEFVNNSVNLFKADKGEGDEDEESEEPESKHRRITHFDGGVLEKKVDRAMALKNTLVIPMVIENDWRVKKLLEKKEGGSLTPKEEAKLALLSSSIERNTEKQIESLPEPSDLEADYNSVPVEAFGLAVLRGCGWKEGDGIGKSNKRVVPLKLPERRPKGLGLGNDITLYKKDGLMSIIGQGKKEELSLKKGSYVEIKRGTYRDQYGEVESFDEDNASVIVKLALTQKNVRVSQYALVVVTAKEFERNSKCINRKAYNEAKMAIANEVLENEDRMFEKDTIKKENSKMPKESSVLENRKLSPKRKEMWIRPELKVRFINKKYKSGKLFNEKVIVIDAADEVNCTIQDASGKIHYQICEDWLETVIPQEGSRIMVVSGRWRGSLAILEVKERKKERVIARLLHSDEVVKLPYDDVCQFIGATDIDDY